MELKEFVANSLTQIAQGIEEASKELRETTAIISPSSIRVEREERRPSGILGDHLPSNNLYRTVHLIEFDVAVHATEGNAKAGGIRVSVGAIGVGAKGTSDSSTASQSRLKFGIPMVLPTGDNPKIVNQKESS